MSLAITGASGQLGRRAAELLLDTVDASEVVLISRAPEKLSAFAASGAQLRAGDFDAPETLGDAFAGVERLLLISTDAQQGRGPQQHNAIEAATAAGVGHVVYTSLPDPGPENPAMPAASHHETEQAIVASGMAYTFLRNALYSEYRVPDAQVAADTGVLRHSWGEGATAYVSREDCAAVAARVLADGAAHENVIYDITGPQLLDAEGLAAVYAKVVGRPVEAVALSDEEWMAGLREAGAPPEVAELMASFNRAIREGRLAQLSDAVQQITGRPPLDVETVVAGALDGR